MIAVVGAGFSGAIVARQLAELGYRVVVFDERNHVAGNCHTVRDPDSGIMVHKYGPHIFHTDRKDVWDYVNRWGKFGPYENRVKAFTEGGMFTLPINLLTINQFFGRRFSPKDAELYIRSLDDGSFPNPKNFEEQAIKMMGWDLYKNFFYGYTKKQWGVEPRELPASILKRLPMRFNYNDNYFTSRYQGIPIDGYTSIVEEILKHPQIELRLGQRFERAQKFDYHHVFWSGPVDAYFSFVHGRLRYRTLDFEVIDGVGDFQGNAVINFCEEYIPYTRVTEHKHFAPWESHEKTICFREFSREAEPGDIPYYPVRLAKDKTLLQDYLILASEEKNTTFIGRLGTYRYLDMDAVIGETLDLNTRLAADPRHLWPRLTGNP